MPPPTSTPAGTYTAGTYYFLDGAIAAYGRAYNAGVLDGLAVTAESPASLVLNVAAGAFHQGGSTEPDRTYAGGTVTVGTADTEFIRVDIISIVWNGSAVQLVVTPGLANDNGNPSPASFPSSFGGLPDVVLATVMVYPTGLGGSGVPDDLIYDRRFFLPFQFSGPSRTLATSTSTGAIVEDDEIVVWDAAGNVRSSDRLLGTVGDVFSNATTVIDGQVALVSDTLVPSIINATQTGRPLLTTGVLSVAAIDLASEVTGNLPKTHLNSGAGASATTFWRGDETWATPAGGGSGDVVGPAASVDDEVVLYSGVTGKLLKRSSATGRPKLTAGVQSVGAIDLASEVTGDLPLANLAQASAASRLLLRGSAAGAGDWQEGTLGAGLSLSGTVLSASGGSGAPVATAQGSYNTDTTERDLLSYIVPASTLGATGGILWYLTGYIISNSGTPTWTLRIKFGSTMMGDASGSIAANASPRSLTLWGMIFNNGSTSSQVGAVQGAIGAVTAGSVAGTMDIAVANTATFAMIQGHGTTASNTGFDVTFSVTSQLSVSHANVNIAWKAAAYLI